MSSENSKSRLKLVQKPAEGTPKPIADATGLARCCAAIAAGSGPVALDAERAGSFRYSNVACLVQIRREGAGTWLIDSDALPDLSALTKAIDGAEWILHAAAHDLVSLDAVNLRPKALFDTELAARLAGIPRVGLAGAVEHYFQVTLAKEHSHVNWARRPLPEEWLDYAALDVEFLLPLREALTADLHQQGKDEFARQEFAYLLDFTERWNAVEPWERVHGAQGVKHRRGLARLRVLVQKRDEIACKLDQPVSSVAHDSLLVALAKHNPRTWADIDRMDLPSGVLHRRKQGRRSLDAHADEWLDALDEANSVDKSSLPQRPQDPNNAPARRTWAKRDAVAANRLDQATTEIQKLSELHHIPVENIITPAIVRAVLWDPLLDGSAAQIRGRLQQSEARDWQIDLVAPILQEVFLDHPRGPSYHSPE